MVDFTENVKIVHLLFVGSQPLQGMRCTSRRVECGFLSHVSTALLVGARVILFFLSQFALFNKFVQFLLIHYILHQS